MSKVMSLYTIKYKQHYIQCKTEGSREVIYAQLVDNPDASFSTFELKLVPSIHAAKLAITRHINEVQSCKQ